MERLTKYESIGGHAHAVPTTSDMDAVMMRLAAYEDTGMEPEEVAELASPEVVEVARLFSELVHKGYAQRIVELAQADRDRRCVVLPCKVGIEHD